jgi:hypothetical protein
VLLRHCRINLHCPRAACSCSKLPARAAIRSRTALVTESARSGIVPPGKLKLPGAHAGNEGNGAVGRRIGIGFQLCTDAVQTGGQFPANLSDKALSFIREALLFQFPLLPERSEPEGNHEQAWHENDEQK